MKSRITIEIDFDNGNKPVIQILQSRSDDVRDSLISAFLQTLQGISSWCRISRNKTFPVADENYPDRWIIEPVSPQELKKEMDIINRRIDNAEIGAKQVNPLKIE